MIRIGRESQCLPYAGFFYNKPSPKDIISMGAIL